MVVPVMPLHLGPLHPVEQVLTLVLAFGPFVVLAIVIVLRRRSEEQEQHEEREQQEAAGPAASAEPVDPGPAAAQRDR